MTDFPSRDLDQLASDLVDGVLPPAETARLRRDPEVAARVARIEELRGALRAVPPPSTGARDRIVATAVAAAAASASTSASESPPRLQAVRGPGHSRPRPERRRSAGPWLAAAAAIVVAGLAFAGLVSSRDSDSSGDQATAGSSADTGGSADEPMAGTDDHQSDDAADSGNASGGDVESAPEGPTVETTEPLSLGSFSTPGELADAVAADRALTPRSAGELPSSSLSAAADSCPALRAEGDTSRGLSTYVADATYLGAAVRVHLYERDGRLRLVAIDLACTTVVDEPYSR